MRRTILGVSRHSTILMLSIAAAALMPVDRVYGHDPTPVLRNLYGAPHAVITMYEVIPGKEAPFLDVMVKTGPYGKLLSGFANERVLQPLPSSEGKNLFISVARYYDSGTADLIEKERGPALQPYLARQPTSIRGTLVEHLLADWGWERRTQHKIVRAGAFKNDEIFQKNISSLSFFKAGYVGQVGMIEFYPKGASKEAVSEQVEKRVGMSGASILALADGSYIVYSEFFRSPGGVEKRKISLDASAGMIIGSQAGVVVQNYVPR